MDATLVTAMAGVFGSLVGGSASVATAWITQKTAARRELLGEEIHQREALYGAFIQECSKLLLDAFMHTLEKPEMLVAVYQLLSRIRLSSSEAVVAAADAVVKRVTEQYFAPNLSAEDLRVLVQQERADPLTPFAHECRIELKAMRAAV
jgi:hypothetical protein